MEDSFLNRDFLQSLDFGDLGEFSFNFSLNSTNNLTEPLPENVPVFSTKKRRMPYLEIKGDSPNK